MVVQKPANLLGQFLTKNVTSTKIGVVVSAGKMSKAVKVRVASQEWNKHIRKYFPAPKTYLVSDPNNSLLEGDVVRIASGHRTSTLIHHTVTAIIAPFGPPVTDRPPVPTEAERTATKLAARLAKDVRSKERGRLTSIWRLKEARAQGYKVPGLEEAMRNVRRVEEERAERLGKGGKEGYAGQTGQMITANEKKRLERQKNRAERLAEEKARGAKSQTVEKTEIKH